MNKNFNTLRNKYKPQRISVLFIGESPPAGNTFFYDGNSILYRYTVCAFNKAFKADYDVSDNENFLNFFMEKGCYLDDLCHTPINDRDNNERKKMRKQSISDLSNRIKEYRPEYIICVMKAIKDHVERAILEADLGTIRFYCLPFPGCGHQNKYVASLSKALNEIYVIDR